jgi:hypothetical protein
MNAIKCPYCDSSLDAAAVKDGWCPECGKAIPRFALRANEPTAEALQRRADRRVFVALAVIMVVFLPLGFLYSQARNGNLGAWNDVVLWAMLGVYGVLFVVSVFSFLLTGKTGHPPLGD